MQAFTSKHSSYIGQTHKKMKKHEYISNEWQMEKKEEEAIAISKLKKEHPLYFSSLVRVKLSSVLPLQGKMTKRVWKYLQISFL